MRSTGKPFVTETELPEIGSRCTHCTRYSISPYLLKGVNRICKDCVQKHSIPVVSDRLRQVIEMVERGERNVEIQSALNLSEGQMGCIRKNLKQKGLIVIEKRRIEWQDPQTKKRHWLSRKEVEIIEMASSFELRYDHHYCLTIAQRLGIARTSVVDILHKLRRMGISVPDRIERCRKWHSKMKEEILMNGKSIDAVARMGKRGRSTPRIILNRQGIYLRKIAH